MTIAMMENGKLFYVGFIDGSIKYKNA